MVTIEEFKQNFGAHTIPKLLIELLEFQNKVGFRNYSMGFGLRFENHDDFYTKKFKGTLVPFATATFTGSTYAFWIYQKGIPLEEMPIILFGDEGGICIIADGLKDLLKNLTIDIEPIIYDDSPLFFDDDEEYEESEEIGTYINWLTERDIIFIATTVEEVLISIHQTQEKYDKVFEPWKEKYYDKL